MQGFDAGLGAAPRAQRVILRNNANLSTGGTATDVTDDVHPEVAARAVAAAQMVGLDICGVDVVCDSVLRPLEEQGGGVVEVNAAPGLRMHLDAVLRQGPRRWARRSSRTMFADGRRRPHSGRRRHRHQRQDHHRAADRRISCASSGLRVGMTSTDGVYVAGPAHRHRRLQRPESARNVLLHPDVDAAVFETARGGILREGLGFDRCDVAVVTNIGVGDHLGLNYITTVEDLAVVKRVDRRRTSRPTASPCSTPPTRIVAAMAEHCPGSGHLLRRRPPRIR